MADSLSVNARKAWTVNVPTPSVVASNLYQYDLFPTGTSRAVMYPQDSLGVMNDSMLYNFDCDASNLLNGSASLFNQVMPLLQKWQAQQAALYQKMMMAISGGTNTNINVTDTTNITNNGGKKQIDGKKVISETEVSTTLQNKIMSDPTWSKIFTSNDFEYTDKDGKKQTTSLLRRLIGLCDDYMKNLKDPELSTENYEKIWDIAGRYAKTGKLSREDYATLVQIAQNPGGPGAYKADGQDSNNQNTTGVRPEKYQAVLNAAEAELPNNYKQLAEEFKSALYIPGTDTEKLNYVKVNLDKYNVVEFSEYFHSRYGEDNGENVIDAIFDDCYSWGEGNHWYTDDDPKPYVTKLSNALIERTQDLIKNNPNMNEDDKKVLQNAVSELENSIKDENITKGKFLTMNISDESEKDISSKYQDLLTKLTKMEKSIYGED